MGKDPTMSIKWRGFKTQLSFVEIVLGFETGKIESLILSRRNTDKLFLTLLRYTLHCRVTQCHQG